LPNIFQISSFTALWEDVSGGGRRFAGGGEGESEFERDKEWVRLRVERAPEEFFEIEFVAILADPGVILDPEGTGTRLDFESVPCALGAGDNFDVKKPLVPAANDFGKLVLFADTPVALGGDAEEIPLASAAASENSVAIQRQGGLLTVCRRGSVGT
jgi:hypothetical protein